MSNLDPVTLTVIQNGLIQVCNEMDLAFKPLGELDGAIAHAQPLQASHVQDEGGRSGQERQVDEAGDEGRHGGAEHNPDRDAGFDVQRRLRDQRYRFEVLRRWRGRCLRRSII